MRLAVDGGLVACFLEELRKGLLVPVKTIPVVHEAILVAVLAGLDYRSAGTADRIGAKAVHEEHSFASQLIDIRRRIDRFQPAIVGSNRVGSMIIGEYEDDIRLIRSRGFRHKRDRDNEGEYSNQGSHSCSFLKEFVDCNLADCKKTTSPPLPATQSSIDW